MHRNNAIHLLVLSIVKFLLHKELKYENINGARDYSKYTYKLLKFTSTWLS